MQWEHLIWLSLQLLAPASNYYYTDHLSNYIVRCPARIDENEEGRCYIVKFLAKAVGTR